MAEKQKKGAEAPFKFLQFNLEIKLRRCRFHRYEFE